MDRKLNITHLPKAHGVDKSSLTNTIERAYDKINQRLPGEMLMDVHFKEFHGQGAREEVEVKAKVVIGGIHLHSSAKEWDAQKALHGALDAIEKEADKAIHKKSRG
ncbi:MAG TPA: HPF/RaiA family ribosome-associated protein [archaeon]|nr:HPF/RaiA family ribosome-associated protein [archaeon]